MREQRDLMLLVEDTAEDEWDLVRLFSQFRLKLDLKILHDGKEALDYFFGGAAKLNLMPLLVLMDMDLPKVHGLEVLKTIKANHRTKSVPVTMMSSSQMKLLVSASRRLGAEDCVAKPIERQTLENILARAYYLSRYRRYS